jgi:hypothetical protein
MTAAPHPATEFDSLHDTWQIHQAAKLKLSDPHDFIFEE